MQTLVQEFKFVALKKVELEYRDNGMQIALLQLVVNEDSNFDVDKIIHDF